MMRSLVSMCVSHHGVVAMLTLLALVLGCWGAARSPLDVFPEFVPSQVDIQTEAPGFAPQQVEELVTRPIENIVNGAAGLATLRSESIPGLSVITITFADGVDLHIARQGISERLAELGASLPTGVSSPKLSPLVSSTMDLLKVGLTSDKVDAFTLRDTADWIIKPRLLAVPGVAHAIVFGGDVRQIQILPDPAELASYNITLTDVSDAAKAALAVRGAGFIDTAAQRILLKSPTPQPDPGTLRQAVIAVRNSVPVRLGDVAELKIAPALRFGDALIQGKPGVLLSLASQYGANTLETTLAVEQALTDLEPALNAKGITLHRGLHRPANFIEHALGNLEQSLVIAAVLILAVLYAFLRDVRAALIAFTAIPLSLLAAVLVLDRMGHTLNAMTLGGFAVALGVLVDDAIIGIENILRRLRENSKSPQPRGRLDIIREASLEVRVPVVHATAVVIAVFLPQLFTSSIQGHFVGPLALAFILAVIASLLVAMTATPALCALLLRTHDARPEARWLTRLKASQSRAVGLVASHSNIQSEVVTFLGDRIGESLSGETAQVAIKVFGDDLDQIERAAEQIVGTLSTVNGIVDLQFARQSGTPAVSIELSPQALAAAGLKSQDVLDSVETAYSGQTVGQAFSGIRTVDTVVLLPDDLRMEPGRLGKLMIASSLGPIPLAQVAKFKLTQDRYSIEHDGGQRRVSVTFNVSGTSLQSVVQQARQRIAQSVVLPPGVFLEFTGAAAAERQTQDELLLYSAVAIAFIVMILFVAFEWRANTWLVMINLPFSLIGGVLAIAATGIGLSLGPSSDWSPYSASAPATRSCNWLITNTWSTSNSRRGPWRPCCEAPTNASCPFS